MADPIPRAKPQLSPIELADLLERDGAAYLEMVIAALRNSSGSEAKLRSEATGKFALPAPSVRRRIEWRAAGTINGYTHSWPREAPEHYADLKVFESTQPTGKVQLALGAVSTPRELYGRERGWVSVWELSNGTPREQRAVFVECDNFSQSGDRIALIYGKDGKSKGLYAPSEIDQLPPEYAALRIGIHRDHCSGRYAKNRLGLLARDDETAAMLAHAMVNLRLRKLT